MALNNGLAPGQKWRTRSGLIVTLQAPEYSPEDRGWLESAEHGYTYCNVEPKGLMVFTDCFHAHDLIEQVE
jgi:hypothetical protein